MQIWQAYKVFPESERLTELLSTLGYALQPRDPRSILGVGLNGKPIIFSDCQYRVIPRHGTALKLFDDFEVMFMIVSGVGIELVSTRNDTYRFANPTDFLSRLTSAIGRQPQGCDHVVTAAAAAGEAAAVSPCEDVKDAALRVARNASDLEAIPGVHAAVAQCLRKAGIVSLDQIARWDEDDVAYMRTHLNDDRRLLEADTWASHARRLLQGLRGPQNLKRIRGIGVLIERRLNTLGIMRYEQIAAWTQRDINRVSHWLDLRGRIERENWVEQAMIMARGGETEFSRRIDAAA